MAKYLVKCSECGEDMKVDLIGKHKVREWKLENYTWICDSCKQEIRDRKNENARINNREAGLPELNGSEKQIAWAETIRAGFNSEIEIAIKNKDKDTPMFVQDFPIKILLKEFKLNEIIEAIDEVLSVDSAVWWIDNRYSDTTSLLSDYIKDKYKKDEKERVEKLELEAKLESTIYPKNCKSDYIATINIEDTKIVVEYKNKNYSFISLLKNLGYRWNKSAWIRNISYLNGCIEDRVTEIGNVLLKDGFPVCIYNDILREKAVNGEYEDENFRWVTFNSDNFFITFDRYRDRNFYDEARAITGSVYCDRGFKVPTEYFEEVEDFAQKYNFKFSKEAKSVLDRVKVAKEKVLVAEVKSHKSNLKKDRVDSLSIDNIKIDDDLRDEE